MHAAVHATSTIASSNRAADRRGVHRSARAAGSVHPAAAEASVRAGPALANASAPTREP
jgi:hypothetical protein